MTDTRTVDVLIVGSDMGGAPGATRLAPSGADILIPERGERLVDGPEVRDSRKTGMHCFAARSGGSARGLRLCHRRRRTGGLRPRVPTERDPAIKVLLLEAGGGDSNPLFNNPRFKMPADFAKMTKGVASWDWSTVPQKHLGPGSGVEAVVAQTKNPGVTLNSAFLRP